MKLRSFTDGNELEKCFRFPTSPMIKLGVDPEFFGSEKDKLEALRSRKKSDKFAIAWPGQWATHVFEITEEDIKRLLSKV